MSRESESDNEAELDVMLRAIYADAARALRTRLQVHASLIKARNHTATGAKSWEHSTMQIRAAAARVARAAKRCEIAQRALTSLEGASGEAGASRLI
ncbi:hypothetical protein B0H11DRAFT_2242698 [Mycena galericulata]|nr:hypothetical protein B0H11DRAFT_2242698 [Mycena galericulata]